MLRWAWKSLIIEPWYLLTSVSAIGGAFALVLFFEAVFAGESRQIVAYVRHSNADVWVMQRGVSNMHMATSFIWDWKADSIARATASCSTPQWLAKHNTNATSSDRRSSGRSWTSTADH